MVAHGVQCFTHLLEHVRLSNTYLKSVVFNIGPGGQNLPAKASNPTAGTTLDDFDCEDRWFFDFKLYL